MRKLSLLGQTIKMVIIGFCPFPEVRVRSVYLMMSLQIYGDRALKAVISEGGLMEGKEGGGWDAGNILDLDAGGNCEDYLQANFYKCKNVSSYILKIYVVHCEHYISIN